jgi:chromosome partitioning protein
MIVTIGNTKGGVGKTTLALNLAIARAMSGRDVWLIDADRQATASTALAIRADAGQQPTIASALYTDGSTLRSQVQHQQGKFQDIVIDAGGRDGTALRAALALSDLVVVPFQPRSIDVWALRDVAELVEEIRGLGRELRALGVLSMADVQGQDNREAAEALADYPAITYIDTPIRRRKSVANAVGAGLCILEYEPVDRKARSELQALCSKIFD